MDYEVWRIYETSLGWCGINITQDFDEVYREAMDTRYTKMRWKPHWYSFEGSRAVVVIVSHEDAITFDIALQFAWALKTKSLRHVCIDLNTL